MGMPGAAQCRQLLRGRFCHEAFNALPSEQLQVLIGVHGAILIPGRSVGQA